MGRRALIDELEIINAGINFDPRSKKIVADNEQTNVPNIFAVGDVLHVSIRLF